MLLALDWMWNQHSAKTPILIHCPLSSGPWDIIFCHRYPIIPATSFQPRIPACTHTWVSLWVHGPLLPRLSLYPLVHRRIPRWPTMDSHWSEKRCSPRQSDVQVGKDLPSPVHRRGAAHRCSPVAPSRSLSTCRIISCKTPVRIFSFFGGSPCHRLCYVFLQCLKPKVLGVGSR